MKAYSYWFFTHDGSCNKFSLYIQLHKCANNNILCTLKTCVSCGCIFSLFTKSGVILIICGKVYLRLRFANSC